MTTEAKPTFFECIEEIAKDAVASLHGPIIGRIESFDAADQTASVRPVHRLSVDGELVDVGVLRNVICCFPSGGSFSLTWHLSAGDFVELLPQDIDIGGWCGGAGTGSDPSSMRRCSLSDLVALPCIRRPTAPLAGGRWLSNGSMWRDDHVRVVGDDDITLASGDVRLGAYSASDYAGNGTEIIATMETYCDAIQTAMTTYNSAGGAAGGLGNVDTMFAAINAATQIMEADLPSWLSSLVRLV